MLVVQFHPEHGSREHRLDATFDFDVFFLHLQIRPAAGLPTKGRLGDGISAGG
jgi:hypothetical protein